MKHQRLEFSYRGLSQQNKKGGSAHTPKEEPVKTKGRESMPARSKMIKRQKILTCNTVEDDPQTKLDQVDIHITHTPKYPKTQKQGPLKKEREEVKSFNIDESFSNKHNTIKKEYDQFQERELREALILDKHQISIQNQTQPKEQEKVTMSGNGLLSLNQGWTYQGEYVAGLFHGFGELYHKECLVYSGTFQYGYLHGYGKLRHHPTFDYLLHLKDPDPTRPKDKYNIDDSWGEEQWTAYFGQFSNGSVSGFGELWLASGEKISSRWRKGVRVGHHWTSNMPKR